MEKLQERGLSRRQAVRILNEIFEEMSHALKRGEEMDFPMGKLIRVKKRLSKRWRIMDHEPPQPYTDP